MRIWISRVWPVSEWISDLVNSSCESPNEVRVCQSEDLATPHKFLDAKQEIIWKWIRWPIFMILDFLESRWFGKNGPLFFVGFLLMDHAATGWFPWRDRWFWTIFHIQSPGVRTAPADRLGVARRRSIPKTSFPGTTRLSGHSPSLIRAKSRAINIILMARDLLI